jgi:hypothetical protein
VSSSALSRPAPRHIDVRGPRFAAWVTAAVLATVLLTGSVWLLAVQAAVFAAGALGGLRASPYGLLFRWALAPRLGPVGETEDPRPPRFAQAVGLGFALVGVVGYATGQTVLGVTATGLALVAALLNAAVGLCLGCELYLLWLRARPVRG